MTSRKSDKFLNTYVFAFVNTPGHKIPNLFSYVRIYYSILRDTSGKERILFSDIDQMIHHTDRSQ